MEKQNNLPYNIMWTEEENKKVKHTIIDDIKLTPFFLLAITKTIKEKIKNYKWEEKNG